MKIAQLKKEPDFQLVVIDSTQIQTVWELVRQGLEVVRKRAPGSWRVEDVYTSLRTRESSLHIAYVNGVYGGFTVAAGKLDPFSGERILLLWITYASLPEVINKGRIEIERLAREHGYSKIFFQSPRRAWARRLESEGYQLREYIFEKDLKNG